MRHLPRDAATVRAVLGPEAEWSLSEYMLATIIDLLAGANWQRTGRKSGKPKPVPRPVERADRERLGGKGVSIAELNERFAQLSGGDE